MKFYTITAVSNFLRRPLISAYHYDMFHGFVEHDSRESPRHTRAWANTESPGPLVISRTIHGIPDISELDTHLVVSERIADRLSRFQNIRLVPVVFKRLVDVRWAKGDMSWAKGGPGDPSDVLRTLPDVPEFHQQIGSFFEVQTFRLKDIFDRYPTTKDVAIEFRTPPLQETEAVPLSSEMLVDYPILWWRSTIVNSEVFDILDAHLDRDFFIIRKYEVP
jgi:hypothetical protein